MRRNTTMSYEAWKASGEPEFNPGPSNQQIATRIGNLDGEINWLIGRLANLVLDEEDRQQTEDYIIELREEIQSLERCFNVEG
jgi:hypothetical protein